MVPYLWPVVPLSAGQLLDVRGDDVIDGGLYRKCNTYRGGGGYDQFPYICKGRIGLQAHRQFVVQLRGCNLDCPYCYVTRAGVWGRSVGVTSADMVGAFIQSGQQVLHLMGGAPALRLPHWPELIRELFTRSPDAIFHSDLMLTERDYSAADIQAIARPRCLYAVNIKGTTDQEWIANTRKAPQWDRFWRNLAALIENGSDCFYVTFTGIEGESILALYDQVLTRFGEAGSTMFRDCFSIDLIEYDALPHVDDVTWGAAQKFC